MRSRVTIVSLIMATLLSLAASELMAEKYDIVKNGKLTKHARFVGKFHPGNKQKEDGAFTFGKLYNFLYAGAGFTSPNARIYIKLSSSEVERTFAYANGKKGNTGAILSINGQAVHLTQDKDHCLAVSTSTFEDGINKRPAKEVKGKLAEKLTPNKPYEIELVLKNGLLTYSVDGKEVLRAPNFPTVLASQPKETANSHGMQLTVAVRPWQVKEMKIYEFYVETDGEIIPMPKVTEIFRGIPSTPKEEQTKGMPQNYRIPSLVVSNKKTLLAFAQAKLDGFGDTVDTRLVVRRSADNGKSWGKEIEIFNLDDETTSSAGSCPVVDRSTGRIWSLITSNNRKYNESQLMGGYGQDSRYAYIVYSDDDGKTWSQPENISKQVKKKQWQWVVAGPGVGIQLERGKHKGRLIFPCDHSTKDKPGGKLTFHSHIVYSDDNGKTWEIGAVTKPGYNECTAVELEDGSVMLNSRLHGAGEAGKNARGVSISRDGGEAFATSVFSKDLNDAHCQGAIARCRWKKGDRPGAIAFSNQAWPWRNYLMVRFSYDDGKTWPAARVIYPWTSAYSSVATLPDGSIGVLFEKDFWGSISFAIVPVPNQPIDQ